MTPSLLASACTGWYWHAMQDDSSGGDPTPTVTEAGEMSPAAAKRSEAYRERFRHSQMVAAQIARAKAAGGRPSESEAARLIDEFHARGGRVTVCPQPEETASEPQDRGTAPRRART